MSTADSGMSRKKTSKLKGNFLAKNLELRACFKPEIIKGQGQRQKNRLGQGWCSQHLVSGSTVHSCVEQHIPRGLGD